MAIHQIANILFTLRLAIELQENEGKPNAKNNEKPETAWETTLQHDDVPRDFGSEITDQGKLLEYCGKREIRRSFSKEQALLEKFCCKFGFVTGGSPPCHISSKYWTFIDIAMTHEATLLSPWVKVKIPDFGRSYQQIYEIN